MEGRCATGRREVGGRRTVQKRQERVPGSECSAAVVSLVVGELGANRTGQVDRRRTSARRVRLGKSWQGAMRQTRIDTAGSTGMWSDVRNTRLQLPLVCATEVVVRGERDAE